MNRIILLILAVLTSATILTAQESAIGLRVGGTNLEGVEASFQTELWGSRVEADLGFGANSGKYNYVNLTGLYQLVFPIDMGFYWFVGGGPSALVKNHYSTAVEKAYSELDLGIAFNGGAEYHIPNIPLQVGIDARPTVYLFHGGDFGLFNFALSARYKF